jgi:apolipoprotein N-acyltransferase
LGLTTGIVFFAGTLYWITHVMVVYGQLATGVAVLVNAALVAYLALYPALFAVVTRRIVLAFGVRMVMVAPLVWVATELGRTHLFTGFPWVLLGNSQVSVLPIAQLASVGGVYGVSALVSAVSAAAATVVLSGRSTQWKPVVLSTGVLVLIVAALGGLRLRAATLVQSGEPVRVGLVQGNVDQAEKWDLARASNIFSNYLRLSSRAIEQNVDVVIWPESSTPFRFDEDPGAADRVRELAREARVPILLGSDEIEQNGQTRYYNSAFLIQSDGSTGGVYRKLHLVPFGEYVPLRRVFFFAAPLVEAVGDFSPGDAAVLLPIDGHLVSTAICYEIVYPDLVRRFVEGGSELLVTITNDAWFGRTSAPYQHFSQAAMRAIENGRYLVRSANTGISGVVDPYGRVLSRSDLFEQTVMVTEARYLRSSTVYRRTGDVFAYSSVVIVATMLVVGRRRVRYA